MKWRWIAAIVCMFYLGVGFVAAAAHDHSGHSLDGHQQCDACAWHHHHQVDVPPAEPHVVAPRRIVIRHEAPAVQIFEVSVGIHDCRGPPSIPQK